MVTIRLARGGAKKRPVYRIVVTDSRKRRDGGWIEQLGYLNPIATGQATELKLDGERARYWLERGATASERVHKLLRDQAEAVAG